jgi:uncharacterized membrane protein
MRVVLVLSVALFLGACRPSHDGGAPATEPASAPAPASASAPAPTPQPLDPAFAGDLDAKGTEPFWAVQIRKETLVLTRPDHADLTAPHGGPQVADGAAVWNGGVGRAALKVTLRKGECSDGMSDRTYPLTAEVEIGDETLKGCGAPAGDNPPQP